MHCLTAIEVTIAPFELLAAATYAETPARILQYEALQLAKAIVADTKSQSVP